MFATTLLGADFSMQTLTNQLVKIGMLRVVRVPEKEQGFYRNLNEPGDLDKSALGTAS